MYIDEKFSFIKNYYVRTNFNNKKIQIFGKKILFIWSVLDVLFWFLKLNITFIFILWIDVNYWYLFSTCIWGEYLFQDYVIR